MLPQSSKEKAARVDWAYHARPGPTARGRRWLWLLAAAVVAAPAIGATVAAGLTGRLPRPLAAAASRGPLASPHAAWDGRCEACHEPFRPMTGSAWLPAAVAPAGGAAAAHKCEACHAGARHHPRAPAAEAGGCGDCHRDHRGRDASLVRPADATCTGCHADLTAHHLDPARAAVAARITGFAADHPEFRQLTEKRRRTVKFSHAVHLAPGMGVGPAGYRFADVPDAAARRWYLGEAGEADPSAPARLTCAACHQLDAGRADGAADGRTALERFTAAGGGSAGLPFEAARPPRAGGAYFLPVTFDAHCRGCHPLGFDAASDGGDRAAPHRVSADALDQFLTEVYAARYITDRLAPPEPDRGPGRLDRRPADLAADGKRSARRDIAARVGRAKGELLAGRRGCRECHFVTPPGPREVAAGADPRVPAAVLAAPVPTVLQPRARFDHAAHRAMACNGCHPGAYRSVADERRAAEAYAAGAADARYQHPPDLPAVDSCRACHSPAGGVRHGCTDCHTYHHADRRLHGRGSPLAAPAAPTADLPGRSSGSP